MQFTLTHNFNTTPAKLYKTWLSSSGHSKMTGTEAEITDKLDEEFSAWDGYISGKNIALIPNKKIKQHWRTTEFPDEQEQSIVEITLEEVKPNVTKLTLHHSNLSTEDDQYKEGWEESYFTPMEEYFG